MSTLQISKMLKRDYRRVKKAADKILKKRKQSQGKGFKDFCDRDVQQLKTAIASNPLLTNRKVYPMAGIANNERDTRCRILKQVK